MCCRYYFDEDTAKHIKAIVNAVSPAAEFRTGIIRPSDSASLITGRGPGFCAEDMRWGFPSYVSGQLMINARAETVLEKKSFSDSVLKRRCVIAAKHFYEWDRSKQKVTFTVPGRPFIYMAGIYNRFEDGDRFTVLTTAANGTMVPVHDRMPLILAEDQIKDWIYDPGMTAELLSQPGPKLQRYQEYEQLSLF